MEDSEENENPLLQYIIYIILTIIISSAVIVFVLRVAEGASFNEKIYAKNIALLIDDAKPGTTILVDIGRGAKIAEKSNFKPEIEIKENKVIVKFAPTKPGFENYDTFFRDLNVEAEYLQNNRQVKLIITEKIPA